MSINASALKIMLAKGLTLEDVVEIATAMEVRRDPTAADRMARMRAKRKGVTCNVTHEPPNEIYSNPVSVSEPNGSSTESEMRSKDLTFPKPDWADPQAWKDFLTNRKKKRQPNTATAYKRFMGDIQRFSDDDWPPGRLLEHAAAKGWAGIYDPRECKNGRTQQQSDGMGRTAEAALNVIERMERMSAMHPG